MFGNLFNEGSQDDAGLFALLGETGTHPITGGLIIELEEVIGDPRVGMVACTHRNGLLFSVDSRRRLVEPAEIHEEVRRGLLIVLDLYKQLNDSTEVLQKSLQAYSLTVYEAAWSATISYASSGIFVAPNETDATEENEADDALRDFEARVSESFRWFFELLDGNIDLSQFRARLVMAGIQGVDETVSA